MDQAWSVVDLDKFSFELRLSVANSLSDEQNTDDLDQFISIKQINNLVESYSVGADEEGNCIITEDIFNDIFDEVTSWIHGVALAKLAAKNLLECAWDNESDEMIFWVPSNQKN